MFEEEFLRHRMSKNRDKGHSSIKLVSLFPYKPINVKPDKLTSENCACLFLFLPFMAIALLKRGQQELVWFLSSRFVMNLAGVDKAY